MKRTLFAALGLAVLLAAGARAQDERRTRPQRPPRERPGFGQFGQQGPLLSKDEQDKLKLTDEQKEKVSKLVQDFEAKDKAERDKIQKAMQKAREDRDQEAFRELFGKMRELNEARTAAEDKLKGLLTD